MWKIKNRIEQKLKKFIASLDRYYGLSKISLPLFHAIKEFSLRKGKRVRPTLFIIGYLGFTKKIAVGLYTSALSIELLHDFMLVHDDIIDKSDTRRGKPSMHKLFDKYLSGHKDNKFNGEDLAIVAGDVMYAMGINAFLNIQENLFLPMAVPPSNPLKIPPFSNDLFRTAQVPEVLLDSSWSSNRSLLGLSPASSR